MSNDQNQPAPQPYPLRDVVDETRRLILHEPDYLPRINHFLFRGRCAFIEGQRVLAVGGTGDALVFLAEQLRDYKAELHYVEPHTPRRTQTLGRLIARDLMSRVTIHPADPATLTPDQIGDFDYISVSEGLLGVDDPSQTLIALSGLLNRTGGMCVTVPGKYGRLGLGLLRACVARLAPVIEERERQEQLVSKLVSSLSGIHPFMAGKPPLEVIAHWQRHRAMLVHDTLDSQDRGWSVDDIFTLLERQELHLTDFTFTDLVDPVFTAYYRPHFFIHDSELMDSLYKLPIRALYAIAEQLHGRMARHTFYASRMAESAASILRLDNVPFLWPQDGWRVQEGRIIMRNAVGEEFAGEVSVIGRSLFSAIDGQRTVGEICQEVRNTLPWRSLSDEDLGSELLQLYGNFGIWGGILVRHESVPAFASYDCDYYGVAG